MSSAIQMRREWAMPNLDTFDVPPIGGFVKKYLRDAKVSVDPFARNKRWATFTNDLNPATEADHHMEAAEFMEMLIAQGTRADLIVIDPPYSPRQVKECYDGIGIKMAQSDALLGYVRGKMKRVIDALLAPGGTVLTFGWNSVGMGGTYELLEVLLVCHGSDHNDTICVAERKVQGNLFGNL